MCVWIGFIWLSFRIIIVIKILVSSCKQKFFLVVYKEGNLFTNLATTRFSRETLSYFLPALS